MAPKHKGKDQWVVRHPDGWAVRGEGSQKATTVTKTQKEAIEAAVKIAQKKNTDVVIQNQRGVVRLGEQHQKISELLGMWDAEPDGTSDAWWDEFESFLRDQRLDLSDN
ncbi:MAG: DUF2188 domain-containing protein [Chloroflexi bacterium]|nr:DUF2188 domain-containing protein [Chloroflexota bacterium]